MSNGGGAAGGAAVGGAAAAHAAAVANAIKASGVLIRTEPEEFQKILDRIDEPLVVVAESGIFGTKYEYLTSWRGLAFFTKSSRPVELPGEAAVVRAKKIWIPG